jgi:alpha-D-xyloside xylohydrolase
MKFNNGYWLLREGVTAKFAVEAVQAETDGTALSVYASSKMIQSRRDCNDLTMLTVTYTAPAPDVIKVSVVHFDGAKQPTPSFSLTPDPSAKPNIQIGDKSASFTSGNLSITIPLGQPWHGTWSYQDRTLTTVESKSTGSMLDGDKPYIKDELTLGIGECIYGLGERFGAFVKNGQSIDIDNQDGGAASEQAYKNIPFYLSSAGYGLLVDSPDKVSFEVGSEKTSRVQFSVPGERLEYYVIAGKEPKEIISRYTALSGRPPLMPDWSYGLWLSSSFTTDYDEKTVMGFLDGMEARHIHVSVFHFDCFWMRAFHWSDFLFDPKMFPDPKGLLSRIHQKGTKVCVWINPYIAQRSVLFAEGKEKGYLVVKPDGDIWQTDLWQPGMALVDFTNADACRWYQEKLSALIDLGVDAFKTDFGERIPKHVVYHDGSDPRRMHNYYTYLYNKTVFDLLVQKKGEGQACLFSRSATVGSQMFPVHWGGDCESTFQAMAETLRGGLSLGCCGFGYWSHDIGGFEGKPDPTLFKRWLQFGLLSSHSRLHGSSSYRVPWSIDEESSDITREFLTLKMKLKGYLLRCAEEAHQHGTPIMRAMFLEFPTDPGCATLDRQYMLGPDILVAPIFSPDGQVDYYLPQGEWVHLLDGRHVTSVGRWYHESYDLHSLPLWVKAGKEKKIFS